MGEMEERDNMGTTKKDLECRHFLLKKEKDELEKRVSAIEKAINSDDFCNYCHNYCSSNYQNKGKFCGEKCYESFLVKDGEENTLREKIKTTLESDKLSFEEGNLSQLEKLIVEKREWVSLPKIQYLEIDGKELEAVSFCYPETEISTLIGDIKSGAVHSLEEEYSSHIVHYGEIGSISAVFTVRRYSVDIIYLQKFREWTIFAHETSASWTHAVAGFDDPQDVGDDGYETELCVTEKIHGPCQVPDVCVELIAKAYDYQEEVKDILKKSSSELRKR